MDHNFAFPGEPFGNLKPELYSEALSENHSANHTLQDRGKRSTLAGTSTEKPKLRRAYSQGATNLGSTSINPIESLPDFTYVLDPVGQILYASTAVQDLIGYSVEEVIGQNIMEFIHNDDVEAFVAAFNDSILLRSDLFHYHRLRRRHGGYSIFEATGHAVYNELVLAQDLEGNVVPACKFFVLSARAYPTKSIAAFDNLLEVKLENERLKTELRNLGEEDLQFVIDALASSSALGEINARSGGASMSHAGVRSHLPTESSISRPAMSRKSKSANNDERNGSKYSPKSTFKSVKDNHPSARDNSTESASCSTTAEAVQSPVLAKLRKDSSSANDALAKKNKKVKIVAELHTCTDCQTTDSPEWRKGPQGPKTLCNACGLRYSKKQKKTELLLQEQLKRRDTSTPRSIEGGYEVELQPRSGPSGSVTPIDAVRPILARASSLGAAVPWPNPTRNPSQPDQHGFDSFTNGNPFWPQ